MKNIIACRPESYGPHHERCWSHLPSIGVRYLEASVPESDNEDRVLRQRLETHGLSVSSFKGQCDVTRDGVAEQMSPQLARCADHGVGILFVSAKAGDTDRNYVWQRLREVGDVAAASGVTVVLETHPDLVTNADVGLQTMQAVDHPNIRINFDTANIHYYNRDVDTTKQLEKVIGKVAAVHLKDTTGRYRTWDFPALGSGIVDFPSVFKLLGDRGFAGPCAIELEGTEGLERDEAAQLEYVADSVRYLKRIGAMEE